MFHLGRDLAKGKLQEIAAAYVGTGDYKLLPKYQAKRKHVDQAKSQKMLEKLGEVPFYKDILTRLKAGEDISAYREAKADDSGEEALEDQEVLEVEVQGANEPREVQKAQGEIDQHEAVGLETMHNALKRMSVSPANSPANSPAASPVKSNEKYLEDNLEDIEKSLEAVEKSLEASQLEEALLSEWHVAGPVTITVSPPSPLPSPSSTPTASSAVSAMASPSIPSMASLAESAIASTAESAMASTATPNMASPAKSAVASPAVSAVASPEALGVASPAAPSPAAPSIDSSAVSAVASPAVSIVASPATLSVASSSGLHMYAGLSASLTRLPGSEIFVLPGRTTSFTVEPKKGFCGQVWSPIEISTVWEWVSIEFSLHMHQHIFLWQCTVE